MKTALFLSAVLIGSAANASTIDTHAFTFTTGSNDMKLVSESTDTIQIQMTDLSYGLTSDAHNDFKGTTKFSMVEAAVKDGYRIVSFTLSATLTGALNVAPLDPACGSPQFTCQLGSATNQAALRWVLTDGSAEGYTARNDFTGEEALSVTNGAPLSLTGDFRLVTETTVYVARQDTLFGQYGSDWYNETYLPSTAAIDFGGPVVLTVQVSAVPEPGSYAMMLGGLGLLGLVARRRRTEPRGK